MRLKTFLLVALSAVWTFLNTGAYTYSTNILSENPARVNGIITLANLVVGAALVIAIGLPRRFDRTATRYIAYPITIIVLGACFWKDMPAILAMILMGAATWMCAHLLEEDHMPISAWHMFAINTALSGALMPCWGWRFEGASDDAISFMLPFVPTIGAFALACWAASRRRGYWIEEVRDWGSEKFGMFS